MNAARAADLEARLRAEGLDPGSWSNGPSDRYAAHEHAYDKVIVVAAGSIAFGVVARDSASGGADRDRIELAVGDRLELPAGTSHDAVVGGSGVTCLEAHVPAGRLTGVQRREAGGW